MSGVFFQDHACTAHANAPVLVLLHGWGMHSAVWETFIPFLVPHLRVRCIDLPGFGRSASVPVPTSLEAMTDVLQEVAPVQAVWMGWSLGGLLAMEMAARLPQRVSHLVLMAATPCFVQQNDWPCAMPAKDFSAFVDSVRQDASTALKRFLALQCLGSVSSKQDLRFLQSCVAQGEVPSGEALEQGLALLGGADSRVPFSTLSLPVLSLLGEHDALLPGSVAPALSSLLPSSTIRVVADAAHVPFLSHPQTCADAILDFIGSRS